MSALDHCDDLREGRRRIADHRDLRHVAGIEPAAAAQIDQGAIIRAQDPVAGMMMGSPFSPKHTDTDSGNASLLRKKAAAASATSRSVIPGLRLVNAARMAPSLSSALAFRPAWSASSLAETKRSQQQAQPRPLQSDELVEDQQREADAHALVQRHMVASLNAADVA